MTRFARERRYTHPDGTVVRYLEAELGWPIVEAMG